MTFAENNRISHRQLYRQMVLAFTAPFLLCLFGGGKLLGGEKIVGTVLAIILLLFYVIFSHSRFAGFCKSFKTNGAVLRESGGSIFCIVCNSYGFVSS